LGLTIALNVGATAMGQESPATITSTERSCEIRADAAVQRFRRNAMDCFAQCYGAPGRSCAGFFLDPQTADCLDRARDNALASAVGSCGGFACPECYGGIACNFFLEDVLDESIADMLNLADEVFCDDAFSPDGTSRAEQRCQLGLASATTRLASRV